MARAGHRGICQYAARQAVERVRRDAVPGDVKQPRGLCWRPVRAVHRKSSRPHLDAKPGPIGVDPRPESQEALWGWHASRSTALRYRALTRSTNLSTATTSRGVTL